LAASVSVPTSAAPLYQPEDSGSKAAEMQPAPLMSPPAGWRPVDPGLGAFSGKVGTGFPQKMRQIKNLDRFPI
jgi:hypothetical protein